jgi:hypothetical protein
VEREDVEHMQQAIECWAMPVPNTVSSIIVGLGIPCLILEDQRTGIRPVKPIRLDLGRGPRPTIQTAAGSLIVAQEIKSLYDLNVFNFHLRNPEVLKTHGLELATIKRTTKMTVVKRDGVKANFALVLTCGIEAEPHNATVPIKEEPQANV